MVNLSYQWTENLLGYFTYSEGYKSGGFNQRAFPPLPEPPAFGPEFVEVYEGGLKLTALEDRLRVNAAIFFSDYTDLQVNVRLLQFGGATNGIQNAGEAEIFGAELEVAWLPVEGLLLEGGSGHLDAEYTKIDPAAVEVTLDKALPNTPEWSANASMSYTWALFDWGTLTPRADWSYRTQVAGRGIHHEWRGRGDGSGRSGGSRPPGRMGVES
jgi:iron complex outermembrane receptor protein